MSYLGNRSVVSQIMFSHESENCTDVAPVIGVTPFGVINDDLSSRCASLRMRAFKRLNDNESFKRLRN